MTSKEIKSIKKDYKKGLKYKKIEQRHNITRSQLIYLIQNNNWKRKSNRSKVMKGNQNAVGNKGGPGARKGNQNAVTTGEYANIFNTVFSEEERKFYEQKEVIEDKKQILLKELKILTIREARMLTRIKNLQEGKDIIINDISETKYKNWNNNNSYTTTHKEHKNNIIEKIENALTRVQEAKRRCVDSLHRIENDNRKLELDIIRLEMEAQKNSETPNQEDIKDDSFIKALEESTEEVWKDYEEEIKQDETRTE